ncbi:MAG: SUMF1/EgtB/PvdO family nonheme iron enzyme, partial [Myxococcales bacterium]|nr:SUMF1/EgtB/PvdO family nonheme iron enzyme [Myxococcales bacterium]
ITPPVTPIPVAVQCSLPNRGLLFMANEVTAGQMSACLRAGGCWETNVLERGEAGWDSTCTVGLEGAEAKPASCINYSAAEQVCDWLGGRLPTKQEWIAEASAGGTRTYPWGDTPPSCERVVGGPVQCSQGHGPQPVCQNPAGVSVSGVCNMAGNIAEFVQDRQECGGTWAAENTGSFRADNCGPASAADELMYWQGVRCVFDQP